MRFTAGHHLYFSNLLISIAAAAMCCQAGTVLLPGQLKQTAVVSCFLFFATYAFYGIHDTYTKTGNNGLGNKLPRALYWQKYSVKLRIPILISLVASGIIALAIPLQQMFIAFSVPLLLAFTYTFPILPVKTLKRWKNHAVLKIFVLAGVWTAVTTLLIPVSLNAPKTWLFLAARLFFMLLICIPFDVRDAAFDRSQMKGKTLPDLLGGTSALLRISLVCTLLALCSWMGLWQTDAVCFVTVTAAAMHLALTCWLCMEAIKDPMPLGRYIWIDSQMIIQSIIIGASMWLAYIRF